MSAAAKAERPQRSYFRRQHINPIPPEHARRQWLITHAAYALLGGDGAISFLNTPDASLGARPLDLAMDNAEGFFAVEQAILLRAQTEQGSLQ